MNVLILISVIVIALLGYPIGFLIAKLTQEELQPGKKYFKLIILASVIGIIASLLFAKGQILFFLSAIFVFILLLSLASLIELKKIKKKKKKR